VIPHENAHRAAAVKGSASYHALDEAPGMRVGCVRPGPQRFDNHFAHAMLLMAATSLEWPRCKSAMRRALWPGRANHLLSPEHLLWCMIRPEDFATGPRRRYPRSDYPCPEESELHNETFGNFFFFQRDRSLTAAAWLTRFPVARVSARSTFLLPGSNLGSTRPRPS